MDLSEQLREALARVTELRLKTRAARAIETDAAAAVEAAERELAELRKVLAGVDKVDAARPRS